MQPEWSGVERSPLERCVTSAIASHARRSRRYACDLDGEVIAPRFVLFMPPQNRRDATDADRTSVDVRPTAQRVEQRQQNVIPFAKPRALAAQAAVRGGNSVEISKSSSDPLAHLRPPVVMNGSAMRTAQQAPKPLPPAAMATPVATGRAAPASYGSLALAPPQQVLQPVSQPTVAPQPAPAPPVMAWPAVQTPPAPVRPLLPPVRPAASNDQDFHHEEPTRFTPPVATHRAPSALAQPKTRWDVFEKLGLGKPASSAQAVSKWLVTAYRVLGFAILTIIVVVLVGYIVSSAFFYVSSSWAVPMQVTASDEKVVSLSAQVGSQQNARDLIADQLNQAERAIVAQQEFQAQFTKAIKGDLEGRRAALARMKGLANTAAGTRAAIAGQNRAYAGAARKRMQQEYAAGLIDREGMLNGKFQLAQISGSNLSLAEKQAEYEQRADELEATARSLDAILSNAETTGDTALSYEVLQIKQQYEASRLELAKAVEARDTLKASLTRQDKLLAALKSSAYLRAIDDKATVAFVPYGNIEKARKGAPVYACKLTMVFCYHVGEVIELLPGEVSGRHPHRDKAMRGQLVEIKLDADDADAGETEVVFVGGKPFIF
jgi:hypothetical protein